MTIKKCPVSMGVETGRDSFASDSKSSPANIINPPAVVSPLIMGMTAHDFDALMELRHRIVHTDIESTVSAVVQLVPRSHFHLDAKGRLRRTHKNGNTTAVIKGWLDLYLCGRFRFFRSGKEIDPPYRLSSRIKKALEKRLAVSR